MRIAIGIATVGRPDVLLKVVDRLSHQTRKPDLTVVCSVSPADVANVADSKVHPEVIFSPRGLCVQRNHILDCIDGRADVVIFFDDDFVPADDYLEEVAKAFSSDEALVGLTGDLAADGINIGSIDFDDAVAELSELGHNPGKLRPRKALYGCNMAIRLSAAKGMRFDENLPQYAWLEDIDFTFQLGRRGRLASGPMITGIHLGHRGARQPGKKLGYSQIANVAYLYRKGTMQPGLGVRLVIQNFASNLAKSIVQDPDIDRRGRLTGNLIALGDLGRGKIDPGRISQW